MDAREHVEPVSHPRSLVSWWARLLAFVMAAIGLSVIAMACTSAPEATVMWVAAVSRGRTGGLCAGPDGGGACGVVVTVRDDGRWTATGFPEPEPSAGSVPLGAASELADILTQGWDDLTAQPFSDTCPLAYDGQETFYTLRRLPRGPGAEAADADVRELRSCTYDLDRPEARLWIDRFEGRWRALGLPD